MIAVIIVMMFSLAGCNNYNGKEDMNDYNTNMSEVKLDELNNKDIENESQITFDELRRMLYVNENNVTLPCSLKDILDTDNRYTYKTIVENEKSSMYMIYLDSDLVCSLTIATGDSDIDIPQNCQLVSLAIRKEDCFSLFDGSIKIGTNLDSVKLILGEPMHNDNYPDYYSYSFIDGSEKIIMSGMLFNDKNELIQMPDIAYIGTEKS